MSDFDGPCYNVTTHNFISSKEQGITGRKPVFGSLRLKLTGWVYLESDICGYELEKQPIDSINCYAEYNTISLENLIEPDKLNCVVQQLCQQFAKQFKHRTIN